MKYIPILCGFTLAATLPAANAALIITPTGVTSTVAGDAGSSFGALINNDGLSSSVATGASTTTALTRTHNSAVENTYVTSAVGPSYFPTGTPPIITFNLGGGTAYNDVDSIVVWNYSIGVGVNSTTKFSLEFFSDTTATASLGSILGLTLVPVTNNTVSPQQVFFAGGVDFDGVKAVKMTLSENNGGNRIGLSEVRFSQVPEPSAALLGTLGLLGLVRRRR